MSEGYFTLDDQWRFVHVNAALGSLLGTTGRNLLGNSFWDEITDSIRSQFFTHLPRLIAGAPPVSFTEFHEPTKRWLSVRANRSEGRIVVFLRDVTAEQVPGASRPSRA